MTLNNNRQDPSNVLQCLAYQVFADAGVATPMCGLAQLAVNGEDMGVYTTLETYDRDFLARHFPSAAGKLYEGQLSDFRMNWVETFENKLQDTFDDRYELYEIARALRADDEDLLDLLEPLIDIDAYLSFWAAESLLGHWDGYNGNQNNFFIYWASSALGVEKLNIELIEARLLEIEHRDAIGPGVGPDEHDEGRRGRQGEHGRPQGSCFDFYHSVGSERTGNGGSLPWSGACQFSTNRQREDPNRKSLTRSRRTP